jgi:DNA-binding PadR family transcriptional regulator
MRRKPNSLLPIELSILEAGLDMEKRGVLEFHGFLAAKEIKDRKGARLLTSHGTLYKALDRLERAGLLVSRWEDPNVAATEGRPRRRLYQVTAAGAKARESAQKGVSLSSSPLVSVESSPTTA